MGQRYGANFVVALGWYVTITAAWWIGEYSIPEAPRRQCSSFCLSATELLPFLIVPVGLPLLLALSVLNALVSRWRLPAPAGGTLSALLTLIAGVIVGAIWAAGR